MSIIPLGLTTGLRIGMFLMGVQSTVGRDLDMIMGTFMLPRLFFDSDQNRRILWGWANESDSATNDIAEGWAGIQVLISSFDRLNGYLEVLLCRRLVVTCASFL